MSVKVEYNLRAQAVETLALNIDSPNPNVTHEISGDSGTLDANSTVPATKAWKDDRQLSSGTDTFDLTALSRGNLNDEDFTGLKVQIIKIKAKSTNTAVTTFKAGTTNGYNLFGNADGEITLDAGAVALFQMNDKLADVGASAKNIDISSTDVDAQYEILLVAG